MRKYAVTNFLGFPSNILTLVALTELRLDDRSNWPFFIVTVEFGWLHVDLFVFSLFFKQYRLIIYQIKQNNKDCLNSTILFF